ncbi:MAG: ketoacyl-ACP synthase III [Candidatus Marinimicrobia bacterium]|nr:ketoacyl-ACP synthase III [Candidatus Neomarinimicrobiota bacterium]MCF7830103.1 ketoacyl-ACP synthase III [Candidatus Neomarinimicrobiota bacterium]MCF7882150.1 ketoacyl-ACP synthase III [Candidatus Neomarinimicrobiota bacterium]
MSLHATITAVGSYVPEKVLTNFDLEKMVETNDEWIRTRTGISERRIAGNDEATSDMSIDAIKQMLDEYDIPPETIDCIIVSTVTPDMFFPSTACLIQDKIGASNAWGFDLSAACSGFVFGLETAVQFVENGKYKRVLLVGADTMSSITDYEDRNTCILFGDGAGVALIEPATREGYGVLDNIMYCDGAGAKFLNMPAGGSRHPATHETVDKNMHYLYQDGRTVFKYAVNGMANVSTEILERNNLTGDDVDFFIPHQANKRIIDAAARKMGLSDDRVVLNIDKYANTTAATIPLGLHEVIKDGRLQEGDTVVFATFGAGFTWGATLLRWGQ